jgi:hypothetical protein
MPNEIIVKLAFWMNAMLLVLCLWSLATMGTTLPPRHEAKDAAGAVFTILFVLAVNVLATWPTGGDA